MPAKPGLVIIGLAGKAPVRSGRLSANVRPHWDRRLFANTVKAKKPATLSVVKKFAPGQPGTRKLLEQYGNALVCVRHRHDSNSLYRYTTVELIVDKRAIRGRKDPTLAVRVAPEDRRLQLTIKAAGGRWDPTNKVWKVPRSVVVGLGIEARVAPPVGTKAMP